MLIKALGEPYPVGYSALGALGEMGKEAFEPLVNALENLDLPDSIRARLARSLFAIEHERRPEVMKDILSEDESSLVRAEMVSACGSLENGYPGKLLALAVNDRSAFVRARAIETVTSFEKLPEGFDANDLVSRLGDPASDVRIQAVSACAHFRLRAALPAMEMLFGDPDVNVAMNAMWTAGNYGDDTILPLLARYANGPDERFHVPAAKSLLQLGSHSAENVLLGKLEDESTREYAIFALKYATSKRAVDVLVDSLSDILPDEREMASFTLYKITGARLDTGRWAGWWKTHRAFWSYDIRDGVEYYFIGLELERDELHHVASEAYTEALRLAPDFPPAMYRMAMQHYRTGEIGKALVYARSAARLMPSAQHLLLEARCLFALDRLDDALKSVLAAKAAANVPDKELLELEKRILEKAAK
ncbi:MAG: HEAT repeat domain-containing protein [Planctomycetota bacterium]|nr:HEAT repeat domain-containing protein [Planctomycetota bacterium]